MSSRSMITKPSCAPSEIALRPGLKKPLGQGAESRRSSPWKPHKGQKRGVKLLLENPYAVLAADPGIGKTSMVYAAFKFLRARGHAYKMLVLAPLKPAYLVWPAEASKWVDFGDLRVAVLHGPTRDESLIADADVCVINYEGLDWLLGAARMRAGNNKVSVRTDIVRFTKFGFDTLVIDELTRVKHHGSGRSRVLGTVLHTFQRRWGLTGSLVANGLLDLFGQYLAIDQRIFGPFVTHYRSRYFEPDKSGFGWNLRDGAEAEIYARIRPITLRLAAEDYVDMPSVMEVVRKFPLAPEIRKIYDALEDDLIAMIAKKVVTAANTAAASSKCRQVCSGACYLEPDVLALLSKPMAKRAGKEWIDLHDDKLDLLEDIVEELQGAPLLVGYQFKHDLEKLLRRFGKDTPYIGGGTNPKDFQKIEKAWNAGKIPLLLGHPQSMAHGINLQGAGQHVAWFSQTWDYELDDQFIRRVRRQGNVNKTVWVYRLVAEKTIDEIMILGLRYKERGQTALYKALQEKGKKK